MASNFPGMKDPRKQSLLGRLADRDVNLAHGTNWSRDRMASQRKLNDAEAAARLEKVLRTAPELKRPPTAMERVAQGAKDFYRGAERAATEGTPHSLGNLYAALTGGQEVPSAYERRAGNSVMGEPVEDALFSMAGAGEMLTDPLNFLGAAAFKPVKAIAKSVGKATVPSAAVVGAAYAGDADAGGLSTLQRRIFNGPADALELGDAIQHIRKRPNTHADAKAREIEFNRKAMADQLFSDAEKHQDLYTQTFLDAKGNAVAAYQTRRQPGKGTSINYLLSDQPGLGAEMLEEAYRFASERPVSLHALPGTEDYYRRFPQWKEDRSEGVSKFIRQAKGGLARIAARMGKDAAPPRKGVADVIKNKGGNWLTGSVEDALGGLKRGSGAEAVTALRRARPEISEQQARDFIQATQPETREEAALNSFIDKQLTRYLKNEMATPEDPIRALAERGVLHFEPQAGFDSRLIGKRERAGFPRMGLGNSPQAQSWEGLADNVPAQASYLNHLPIYSIGNGTVKTALENQFGKFAAENPDALAYAFNKGSSTRGLGFSHLIDELANSLNPESGLPRHLLLDPKSMARVSVPQAVERVSQINAWRAAQKAEADAIRANNAATVLHKDYPDKGFKWVELKAPPSEDALPLPEITERVFRGRPTFVVGEAGNGFPTVEEARTYAKEQAARNLLQDALKYEGDTMGHCVGGYCDDVASGRTKIYSLRDAKGQPHVTVEVQVPQQRGPVEAAIRSRARAEAFDPEDEDLLGVLDAETLEAPRIVQIKGKQNRAPNEEYLPFVQDFVRSGKWSDVGDLQNSGLQRAGWSPETLQQLQKHGIEAPEYGTVDEINAALNALNKAKGFAGGGSAD